jgi:adenylate cyclase
MVRLFEQGVVAYRSRDFPEGIKCFEEALQRAPGDEPARIFLGRCRLYLREPPAPDWDGVFDLHVK